MIGDGELVLALQERLQDFGVTKNESKIYVFLSKHGTKKAIEISREEKIPRTVTYHLLTTLEAKGIITPTFDRPKRFSAVTIEKTIESILHNKQKKIEGLKILEQDMMELWNLFQNMMNHTKPEISKFESTFEKYSKSERLKKFFNEF